MPKRATEFGYLLDWVEFESRPIRGNPHERGNLVYEKAQSQWNAIALDARSFHCWGVAAYADAQSAELKDKWDTARQIEDSADAYQQLRRSIYGRARNFYFPPSDAKTIARRLAERGISGPQWSQRAGLPPHAVKPLVAGSLSSSKQRRLWETAMLVLKNTPPLRYPVPSSSAELADKITQLIKSRGFTPASIGSLAGVPPVAVSAIVSGRETRLSAAALLRLSKITSGLFLETERPFPTDFRSISKKEFRGKILAPWHILGLLEARGLNGLLFEELTSLHRMGVVKIIWTPWSNQQKKDRFWSVALALLRPGSDRAVLQTLERLAENTSLSEGGQAQMGMIRRRLLGLEGQRARISFGGASRAGIRASNGALLSAA